MLYLVRQGLATALGSGKATPDLAPGMPGCREVSCSDFGKIICETIQNMS
ncbi:MAG: hypothetical protein GY737_26710 [Desulfobacteraceae bacterium]|nr:hypothetical protein [Desulfobacteraceae bacterium]